MKTTTEYEILEYLKRIENKIDGLKKIEHATEYIAEIRKRPVSPDVLLTIEEVAEVLHITKRTIKNWIKKNYIAFVTLPGKGLRIKKANLDNWIERRTAKELYRY